MTLHVCIVLRESETLRAEAYEAATDREAWDYAKTLLNRFPQATCVDIWKGGSKIHSLHREESSEQ
jgi:hypothetical protein